MEIKTVKEVKEMYKNEFDYVEVYKTTCGKADHFHTDNCIEVDYEEDTLVYMWELMDEWEYNHSILANTDFSFDDIFDKNDKILVMMIA